MNYEETYSADTFIKHIEQFDDTFEYLPFEDKKKLLHSIVKEVIVDRENITLSLYFLPTENFNSVVISTRMHKDSCWLLE